MNESQSEKLDRIHQDVRESKTRTRVIDERTKTMSDRMDSLREDIDKNEQDINNMQGKVKRNTTILGGVSAAATAVTLWVADKLRMIF